MESMAASPMTSKLIQLVVSLLIDAISIKGVMRSQKGQESRFLPL